MKTFFHEETGANQFALTITFAGPSGDPSVQQAVGIVEGTAMMTRVGFLAQRLAKGR